MGGTLKWEGGGLFPSLIYVKRPHLSLIHAAADFCKAAFIEWNKGKKGTIIVNDKRYRVFTKTKLSQSHQDRG